MITNDTESLFFGALDLLGHRHRTTEPFWFEAVASGSDFGNPVPIERVLSSFLKDGAISVTEGNDNREMAMVVIVCGIDADSLSRGEMALVDEVARRNVLTWSPPAAGGAGAMCVFDVVNSSFGKTTDDFSEKRLERKYTLSIKALPFARAQDLVQVVSAAPPSATPAVTVVDACTSLSGWSNGGSGTTPILYTAAPYANDALYTSYTNSGTTTVTKTVGLTRSGLSISMASTPYVRLQLPLYGYGGVAFTQVVKINGVVVEEAARNGETAWFLCPSGTLNSVTVIRTASIPKGRYTSLTLADVSRSNIPQDTTGARQRFLALTVAGSVRTEANLALQDPATALGTVLVHTMPADSPAAQPPLRVFRTSGPAETVDSTLVSGKSSDLSTNHVFDLPAGSVPAGGYLLYARVKHASVGPHVLTWSAKSRMGTTNDTGQSGTRSVTVTAGTYTVVEVAQLTLPTRQLGPSGLVRVELQGPAGMLLDEAWIFNVSDGRLTFLDAGTAAPSPGGSSNRVWLDAASIDNPSPAVWMGNAADRSDALDAGPVLRAFGEHEFVPPAMNIFFVTSNSVATDVTLSHYPRFHTHVVGP